MKKQLWQWSARVVRVCMRPVSWIAGIAATLSPVAQAQVVPTADGAGTTVAESEGQYDIAGGTQASGNLFHEFDEFSLSEDQVANFASDSGVFNIVGQVSEARPSYIDGTVQVSGSDANLYLVNPSGVLFGPNAQLSLSGSFTATTADQIGFGADVLNVLEADHDYAGLTADPSALTFTAQSASAVVNEGDLAVDVGESIALVGGSVVNTGRLEAPGGEVGLVAVGGDRTVRLAVPGSLLSMEVNAAADIPIVSNDQLKTTSLPQLLTGRSVQNDAQSLIVNSDGSVTLHGEASSFLIGSGTTAVAGEVSTQLAGQSTGQSAGANGGTVAILGESVALVGAQVNASGDRGGTVRIGGDISGQGSLFRAAQTTVDAATTIQADGRAGAGGSIVAWADDVATVHGSLSAQGQTTGGFIETSAHTIDIGGINADASGQASAGTWLVDPGEIEVVSGTAGMNQISTDTIESALNNNNNFEVRTDDSGTGDITLSASINQTNASSNARLTFAGRRFEDNGHEINLAGTGLLQFLINVVNSEATQDSSSIQNAIDAIGNVNGQRRLFLESGNYDFSQAVVIDTDVEIAGDLAQDTFLTATGNEKHIEIAPGNTVSLEHMTFRTQGLMPGEIGGGVVNQGRLTVEESTFIDNRAVVNGGAIDNFVSATQLTVRDSEFLNNSATFSGGAIFADNIGNVVIDNAVFDGNSAMADGGAVQLSRLETATITNSRFINNVAMDDGGGVTIRDGGQSSLRTVLFRGNRAADGGGAFNGNGTTVSFEDATFSNNRAGLVGGGLFLQQGDYALNRSTVSGNSGIEADGSTLLGGGVFSAASTLVVSDTDILLNVSEGHGGGLFQGNSNVTIANGSTLERNSAADKGGGLFAFSGTLSVVDSDWLNNSADAGGAIFSRGTNVATIATSEFSQNHADNDGGAIFVEGSSSLVLEQSRLADNVAEDQGGALYYDSTGAVEAAGTTFEGNGAESDGGAIATQNPDGILTISDSILQNNHSQEDGGAIYAANGTAVVAKATRFVSNRAEGANSQGGSLSVFRGADISLIDTEVAASFSQTRGGGLFVSDDSTVNISSSTLSGNQAIEGGGLFNTGAANLLNTTISGNRANSEGGAIRSAVGSELTVRNSTVAANRADTGGGISATEAQLARLQNTIVADNSAETAADVLGHFVDVGNNLIGQAEGSSGFTRSALVGTAADPLTARLAPLANNGGPTKTHLLLPGSAAIDAGGTTNLPAVDQRGQVRFSGRGADIGSVEQQPDEGLAESVIEDAIRMGAERAEVSILSRRDWEATDDLDVRSQNSLLGRRDLSSDDVAVQKLERSFSQSYEDYWDLSAGEDLTFSQVQEILKQAQEERSVNSAVVYAVFASPDPTEADTNDVLRVDSTPSGDDLLNLSVVLPAGELVSYQLPVTRRQANRQVRLLRSSVSDPGDARGHSPFTQQLYQWLLAPIEEELAAQNIHNLVYALDAGLRTAPIAAMRDYEGYSLERYGISVVPSMGLMQTAFPVPVRRATVAMGVSEFVTQPPLPAVPLELEVLDNLVPASQTILNEETTLATLTNVQAFDQPGILHLATHASFDNQSPESSPIHLWNEDLSMKAFSQLGWDESDLEMLILSACSTALSGRNSELGFAGLAAAAGVAATVGSLWEVSDVGTLALMSEFYAQLEQTTLRGDALRNAQLALLRGETRIEQGRLVTSHGDIELPDEWAAAESVTLDHPFFWSAFTMVGNPW